MNSKNLSKIITISVLIIVIIAIILLFQGNGDTAKLELNGLNEMIIYQYDQFIDPGYNIVEANNKTGFYVNVDGRVNTNQIGIYFLKYYLYNKKGVLVSSNERKVIVLQDKIFNVTIELNGDEEEYYFVNDYTDKGAVAYQNNNDITHLINIDSNVNDKEVGKYEVRYQIILNNKVKEVIRKVNIIDLDVKEDVDFEKQNINLIVNCDDYAYTLLPDGIKEYSKNVDYLFKDVGVYEFLVFLKSGSSKKYSTDIVSIDKEGPVGTCDLEYDNNKTIITMNVTDKTGISKYLYNGLTFTTNQTTVNGQNYNVTVRAYDKANNFTDIKCKAKFSTGFKNINVNSSGRVQNKLGYIKCDTQTANDSRELDQFVQSYGYKTRDGVVAAAVFLANYKYDIPYFWGGKTTAKGIFQDWGCSRSHRTDHQCGKPLKSDYSYCELGLDCGGFIRWAYIQAGFTEDIVRGEDIVEHKWGNFNPRNYLYKFNSNNLAYINQIKPGDLIHREGHIGLIIGVTNDKLQVAEMKGPLLVTTINKFTGASISKQGNFTEFVLMEEYFKMYGNS